MRRIVSTLLLFALAGGAAFALTGAGGQGPSKPKYKVVLDNAFGLVEGADLKVAGVRAGTIKSLDVDKQTHKAIVGFEITQEGFGSLRKDVTCETRPQSLIGEYYIDCKPGSSSEKLADGATIPVEQTTSTIPIDLVNNVLRRPYRERLGIILDELGAGVAGRAQDINDVIRRASPALRETDRVLAKLATQNQTLKQLITDADTTLGDLAANKRNVGRWVVETKETAAASAERRADIQAGLQRLPTFLRELRPTMAALGDASEAQTPALQNLNASAEELATFLEQLKPLSESTQVNLRSLAEASRKGRPAVKAAQPVVAELSQATRQAPELANNSAIVFEHLNDRKNAVEKDPRSPGGQGYTGFEAVLQWVFDQSQAINIYDKNGYMLKVNLFHSKCSDYQNLQSLKEEMAKDPSFYKDCAAILGPHQPGITQPDPTATGRQFAAAKKAPATKEKSQRSQPKAPDATKPEESAPEPLKGPIEDLKKKLDKDELRKRAIERLREAIEKGNQDVDKLRKRLEDRLGIKLPAPDKLPEAPSNPSIPTPSFPAPSPGAPAPSVPSVPSVPDTGATGQLLDYLLAP
ncbi:MAG TPA: MlaD family protein [Solirubrobacteraceae bacterium]|nr:MlaD family protein [Solirubrobacteraceae bacterium]